MTSTATVRLSVSGIQMTARLHAENVKFAYFGNILLLPGCQMLKLFNGFLWKMLKYVK